MNNPDELKYEAELEAAAEILSRILPIGQVKTIGLLEVAAGVAQLDAILNEHGKCAGQEVR